MVECDGLAGGQVCALVHVWAVGVAEWKAPLHCVRFLCSLEWNWSLGNRYVKIWWVRWLLADSSVPCDGPIHLVDIPCFGTAVWVILA